MMKTNWRPNVFMTSICLMFVLYLHGFAQDQAPEAEFKTIETIDLSTGAPGMYEEVRIHRGGDVTAEGWKTTDSLSQMIIVLKDGFYADQCGAIELEMTNLNPLIQPTGNKNHFFSFNANPIGGSGSVCDYKDGWICSPTTLANFVLRMGKKRYRDENGQGIKILWKGHDQRHEHAPIGTRNDWDESKTYVWRAEWDTDSISFYMNGEQIFGPVEFGPRDTHAPLRYIYLGRSTTFLVKDIPPGFPGPVYQKIRLYRK